MNDDQQPPHEYDNRILVDKFEAAELLSMTQQQFNRFANQEGIPCIRTGRTTSPLYRKEDLKAAVERVMDKQYKQRNAAIEKGEGRS